MRVQFTVVVVTIRYALQISIALIQFFYVIQQMFLIIQYLLGRMTHSTICSTNKCIYLEYSTVIQFLNRLVAPLLQFQMDNIILVIITNPI